MKIDPDLVVGGQSVRDLRDILKELGGWHEYGTRTVAQILRRRIWRAHLDDLVKSGVVDKEFVRAAKRAEDHFNRPGSAVHKPIPDQTDAAGKLLDGLLAEGLVERAAKGAYTNTVKGDAFVSASMVRMDRGRADTSSKAC